MQNQNPALRCFLLLLIVFLYNGLFAQKDSCNLQKTDSSTFVENFTRKNYVQVYTGFFKRQFHFIPRKMGVMKGMKDVMLSSNAAAFAGISVKYKKMSAYFETAIPQTALVHSSKTKVRGYSFFISQFYEKWGITGFLNWNKGLLTASNGLMRYTDRNDLRMFTTGAYVYRIFNPKKFSYQAANSQSKLQVQNHGSFALMTTILYRKLYSNESIVPDSISKYHFTGSMEPSKNLQFYSTQLRPGYIYNLVFKQGKYFIAPALYAGMGADYHVFNTATEMHGGANFNWGYRFKMVAGINGKKMALTAELLTDRTTTHLYYSKLNNIYNEASINFSYRF